VARDLTDDSGAFYSAEDADSEGEEGKFYLWTRPELRELLPPDEADLIADVYGVEEGGNFHDEATGRLTGANILFLRRPLAAAAQSLGTTTEVLEDRVATARATLLAAREGRVRPHRDDKILTDWNGLMIAALAIASVAFGEPEYLRRAEAAAAFILTKLREPDGRLLHRFREGDAAIAAHLDDYAFLVWALTELYEAGNEPRHLEFALRLTDEQLAHFWDHESGGFFFTADDGEALLVRQRQVYDGAVPSGNSISALNLLRLARLTGRADLEDRGRQLLSAFATAAGRFPASHTQLMSALDFGLGPTRELVIVGDPLGDDTRGLVAVSREAFAPRLVTVLRPAGDAGAEIARLAPFTAGMDEVYGRAAAYVCADHACQRPVTGGDELRDLLADVAPAQSPR
jgi:uncharacterized protein YyaL (SSP411 family)